MKKYWGKKEWSESIYLWEEYNEDCFDEHGNFVPDPNRTIMSEYHIGMPFNWNCAWGFEDTNAFEDMNAFITYSEKFNVYQASKI